MAEAREVWMMERHESVWVCRRCGTIIGRARHVKRAGLLRYVHCGVCRDFTEQSTEKGRRELDRGQRVTADSAMDALGSARRQPFMP